MSVRTVLAKVSNIKSPLFLFRVFTPAQSRDSVSTSPYDQKVFQYLEHCHAVLRNLTVSRFRVLVVVSGDLEQCLSLLAQDSTP